MSLRQDLINNIGAAINAEMNDTERIYSIYTEDNLSEPTKPYFSIRDIAPNRNNLLVDNYKYSELVIVEYHPAENTQRFSSLYEVSEHLNECLSVVNGTRGTIEQRIVDGVLICQCKYSFTAREIKQYENVRKFEIETIAE